MIWFKKEFTLWFVGALLLAYCLLFYVSNNLDSFSVVSVIIAYVLLFSLNAFFLLIIRFILIKFLKINAALVFKIIAGIICVLFLIMMRHSIFSIPQLHQLNIITSYLSYAIFGLIFFSIGFLIIPKESKSVIGLISILILVNVIKITNTVASERTVKHDSVSTTPKVSLKNKKNIFFILTDSLTSIDGMDVLGIKDSNRTALDLLTEKKFINYPGFYSSLQPTINALFTYLNLSYNKDNVNGYLLDSETHNRYILNDAPLYTILRKNGYKINILHQVPFFKTPSCLADTYYVYSNPSLQNRVLAIIAFLELPNISVFFSHYANALFFDPKNRNNADQMTFKYNIISQIEKLDLSKPNFTYIHAFNFPSHSANDLEGICNEKKEIVKYNDRIQSMWQFVLPVVNTILSRDKDAIIIIAGDHGPYIFNKCTRNGIEKKEEITERQGAFLSIYWGNGYHNQYDTKIKSSQNLFRYILSFLAENEALLLTADQDNAYTYNNAGLYLTINNGKYNDVFTTVKRW